MPTLRKIEQQQRLEHLRRQAQYELYWRNRIFIALRKQKKRFTDAARNNGLLAAYVAIDQYIVRDELDRVLNRLYEGIAVPEAEASYRQWVQQKDLGELSIPWFNSLKEWLQSFLYDMITRITDTTKRLILQIITEGIEQGDSYDGIIERIAQTGFDRTRAATIARTETNRAMGWAKWEAIRRLPYAADVVWIAARDKRTRGAEGDDKADHFHMNGDRVAYPNAFTDPRNGDQLLFPGDVSLGASAKSVINCRCTIAARRRQ